MSPRPTAAQQLRSKIEGAAARWLAETATICGGTAEPREEVWGKVTALRQELWRVGARTAGVAVRDPVWQQVAALATLAGKVTYVPLSARMPVIRRWEQIQQSGADTLIVGREDLALVEDHPDWRVLGRASARQAVWIAGNDSVREASDVAYVMFTSGSSGKPKGVPIGYQNLCSLLDWIRQAQLMEEGDRIVQTFDIGFDLSLFGIVVPWLTGGTTVLPHPDDAVFRLPALVTETQATVWFSVPTTAYLLWRAGLRSLPSLRRLMFCGELLHGEVAAHWRAISPGASLFNLYGPTECTLFCAYHGVAPHEPLEQREVPIGRLVPGHQARLLADGVESPASGELLVSGPQVFDGYLAAPALPADADGRRWYATGDLVRKDSSGILHFFGRADRQVKISGYRVELGEIEEVLRSVPGVVWAAVSASAEPGRPAGVLHARVIGDVSEAEVIAFASHRLPAYMVPRKVERISDILQSVSGKTKLPPLGDLHGDPGRVQP